MSKSPKNREQTSISTPSASVIQVSTPNAFTTTTDSTTISSEFVIGKNIEVSDKSLENAIYGYLRSLKTAGRDKVGVEEIANAFSVSLAKVYQILERLKNRGVKLES